MNIALLKKRIKETPVLEPMDAVKLAYQSEFGCGHLLEEEGVCASRIAQELAQTAQIASAEPFVDIGGGLCRINLHAAQVRSLAPLTLARMMLQTAERIQGSLQGFEAKLETLREACRAGLFLFTPSTLDAYLAAYAREEYPPVSHSEAYRVAYAPAYRVVLRSYGDMLPSLVQMEARLAQSERCIIALDGDCGAGKTTLAELIAPLYLANVIHMDDFFLPPALRVAERLQEAGGNIHYERFAAEILPELAHGKPFSYTRYDCHTGSTDVCLVTSAPVTVIEGSYSHHPVFARAFDELSILRIWVKVEKAEQLRRLEKRNPALLPRFQREWIPLEKSFAEAYDLEEKADFVIKSLPWEENGL